MGSLLFRQLLITDHRIVHYVVYVRLLIVWREEEVGGVRAPISHARYMDLNTWTPPFLDLLVRAVSSYNSSFDAVRIPVVEPLPGPRSLLLLALYNT